MATPGPWLSWVEGRDHVSGDSFVQAASAEAPDLYPRVVIEGREWNPNWVADQDFIAAANPSVVLRLIRLIRGDQGSSHDGGAH